jgi:phosphate transport system protein
MDRFFDSELVSYRSLISRLLLLTHQQLNFAVEALLKKDRTLAERVIEIEKDVDQLEIEVDGEAVRFLNMRSPIASELRLIMAGSRMSHEFERIGDEAKKIAKRAMRTERSLPESFTMHFHAMHEIVESMFRQLQETFTTRDAGIIPGLIAKDEKVDHLNKTLQDIVLQCMERQEIQLKIGIDLISCSRALERMGDHATNVAEIMNFLITGQDIRSDLS